jgi:hypothetical protein
VIRHKLNILNLNIRIKNNRRERIHNDERIEPEHLSKQMIGCTYRETRPIGRRKLPWKVEPVL